MASPIDTLRDRWERITPRERRLIIIAAVVLGVLLVVFLAGMTRNGLSALEEKNQTAERALRAIAVHRQLAQRQRPGVDRPEITAEGINMVTYLDGIVSEVGVESPSYPRPKTETLGEFLEETMTVKFSDGMTIYQLRDLLEKIETRDRRVVIKELSVEQRSVNQKDKVRVDMVVATYRRAAAEPAAEGEE